MGSNRFRVECLARIGLMGLTIALFIFLAFRRGYPVTAVLMLAAALIQAWLLLRYMERAHRNLRRFLDSIQHADLTATFEADAAADGELGAAFATVLDRFRALRAEREERHRYLETLMQHVEAGLVVFDAEGAVELANTAAERLLGVPCLRAISDLAPLHPDLASALPSLAPGERRLIPVTVEGERFQLALRASAFVLRGRPLTLVSFHDIRSELEEKEMESWQNLIRVLTHEIMNSITPIASLAATANVLLDDAGPSPGSSDPETLEDIRGAVRTIEQRSRGLLHFVENYRRLTRIPQPRFKVFPLRELFGRVEHLLLEDAGRAGIAFEHRIEPEDLELAADPELLEQVLINLVQNSLQALQGRPEGRVGLHAASDDQGRVIIRVTDNGPGIMEDVLPKVFIPFFTTKRDGSGIGLSLSRQILRLHHGTITVRSEPGVETEFMMKL